LRVARPAKRPINHHAGIKAAGRILRIRPLKTLTDTARDQERFAGALVDWNAQCGRFDLR